MATLTKEKDRPATSEIWLVCCTCGSLLVTDDVDETKYFKHTSLAKKNKSEPKIEHVLRVAETITLKNPADEVGLVNHLFDVLRAQTGNIKVKLVGNGLSPRYRDYLNAEGNRSL